MNGFPPPFTTRFTRSTKGLPARSCIRSSGRIAQRQQRIRFPPDIRPRSLERGLQGQSTTAEPKQNSSSSIEKIISRQLVFTIEPFFSTEMVTKFVM